MNTRKLFALIAVASMFMTTYAQLLVKPNGEVNVGLTNTSYPVSEKFSVYSNSKSNFLVNLRADSCTYGVYLNMGNQAPNTVDRWGLVVDNELYPNTTACGIMSTVARESSISTGRAFGILAQAGQATSGFNYGICTSLFGSNYGTALFASSGNNPYGYQIPAKFAGFFDGNVEVVGHLQATTISTSSDYRLKTDIRNVDESSLERIKNMNVVRYKIKQMELDLGDTARTVRYKYEHDSPILKTDHYGLIAQELREIYPELVYEGGDGYLSINYIELIPLLIKSIQELNGKVEELENNANKSLIRGESDGTTSLAKTALATTVLYQNTPNPFTENTQISCVISKDVKSAVLYIYDMNGRQIDSMPIEERGEVTLTIQGRSLDAGIYMYSLITDGQVIDTKRMVLTK